MATNIFTRYLGALGVAHTVGYSSRLFAEEPFNRSLYGISILLSRYHIENKCVRFVDKKQITEELVPFLIVLDSRFEIVTSITESTVTLTEASGKIQSIPFDSFLEKWDGVGLFATPDNRSGEPEYRQHQKEDRKDYLKGLVCKITLLITVILSVSITGAFKSFIWWIILIVNSIGLYISYLLLLQQLNIPDKVADKICGFTKEHKCDKVTSSDASSVFGIFKLSEVGFSFFIVNIFVQLFAPGATFWMALAVACSLPFTLWSLWYQKFRIHAWCALCLSILGILWTLAIVCFIGNVYAHPMGDIRYGVLLGGAYILIILLLNSLMSLFARYRESRQWKRKYNSLKMDTKVIDAYEGKMPDVDVSTENCTTLIFGNPEASRNITLFSNPYCGPCAKMHSRINDFPSDTTSISYVMTSFSEDRLIINRYIIAAYQQLGADRTWELMTRWFDGGKSLGEKFFEGLGLDPNSTFVDEELIRQRNWRESIGRSFAGTPTVLVNGREVVHPYIVEDYLYM